LIVFVLLSNNISSHESPW